MCICKNLISRSIGRQWAGGWLVAVALLLLLGLGTAHAQTVAPVLPTEVARISFAAFLQDFLLDPANNRIYVTDQNGTLTVLDATDHTVLVTLPTVRQAKLTLAPDRSHLYVSPSYRRFNEPAAIQVIDTATLTVSATITNATDITFDPAHSRIFVGNALLRPMPPNAPVAGLRVLDAMTLAVLGAAPLDGIPVYNPLRDELLLAASSLFRVDPADLTIQQDLFPEITAQSCPDCIGASEIVNLQVLAEAGLIAFERNVRSTPTGGRMLPATRFLDATTLAEVDPQPVAQPTCDRRAHLQPALDNRVYRHQAYASTFLFHNWRIETPDGDHLRTIDGLDAPFLNPNTKQAYAGGWILDLPDLEPVGRLPALTCIWDYHQERGLIYAQFQNQLVILAEAGDEAINQTAPATAMAQLPVAAITEIIPVPDFPESETLFVTQHNTLYRSTDGGAQWTPLTGLPLHGVMPLQVALSPDFATDRTLFVGGGSEMGESSQLAGGLFRSTDGGDRWQPLWHGLDQLRVSAVAVSPHYTADQTVLAYAHVTDVATGFSGAAIQRSTYGGLHWSVWLTMTDGLLPSPEALLSSVTPASLPVRLNQYNDQLLRPSGQEDDGQTTESWEGIDLRSTLGSTARALVAAPDLATSGMVYVMGDSALWRVKEAGATIQAWNDGRLVGRTAYTEVLTSLAVTAPDRTGAYRLIVGTGGGEIWVLDPATVDWTAPLTVTAAALTPEQAGMVTQPLLSYLHTQTTTVTTTTELVLRNPDGTGRRAVALPATIKSAPSASISPDGRWLAYYTGQVSLPTIASSDDLTLHLLDITTGASLTVVTLLPPDFPDNLQTNANLIAARLPDLTNDPELVEGIWWAFADALTIHAWSPDGRTLAFAGATDGPSSDLYLYETVDGTITRLTDGPEQITAIRWSPDGEWIWHSSVAIGFCQGCYGHQYAAARDGSTIITLPGDEGDRFLGWLGPATYLESDGANGIGYFDLRTVNLTGEPGRDLWPGVYHAFVLDWMHQRLVVEGSPSVAVMPNDVGLYNVNLATGAFMSTTITATQAARLITSVNPGDKRPLPRCPTTEINSGQTLLIHPCNESIVSSSSLDGRWVVDQTLTLRTVDGRAVLPSAVAQESTAIYWRPDSAGYYFLVEGDLYYRPLLDSWPVLLEREVSQVAWVGLR